MKQTTIQSTGRALAAIFAVVLSLFFQTVETAAQKKTTPKEIQFTSATTPLSLKPTAQCKKTQPLDDEAGDTTSLRCAGAGDYTVYVGGNDSGGYNYGAAVQNLKRKYLEYVVPIGSGNLDEDGEPEKNANGDEPNERAASDATKYASSEYVQKLGDKIEWILADGKPVAFITSVSYYKQDPNIVFKFTAKNKAADFVLVRGLAAYAELQEDLDSADTALNMDEKARVIVYEFVESRKK